MNPNLYLLAIPTVGLLIATVWAVLARPRESPVVTRLQAWSNWEQQQDPDNPPPRRLPQRKAVYDPDAAATPLSGLNRLLVQANSRFNVTTFLLMSAMAFLGGGFFIWLMTGDQLATVVVALVAGIAPYGWLLYKKRQYLRQIESQLPQALDILAQSLQAGHTIQTGIRTIGESCDEPIRSEFSRTSDAIELGVPLPTALEDLSLRVDIADLRFFITSVLVQRETGGNLAEIIARTADVIRKRLEFADRIRALSAEGKASAYILFCLPLALGTYFYFADSRHFRVILDWEWGLATLVLTAAWMLVGMIIIHRMAKIDV